MSLIVRRIIFLVGILTVFSVTPLFSAEISGLVNEVRQGTATYIYFAGSSQQWACPSGSLPLAIEANAYNATLTCFYNSVGTCTAIATASPGHAIVDGIDMPDFTGDFNATVSLDSSLAASFEPLIFGFAGILCAAMVFFPIVLSIKRS